MGCGCNADGCDTVCSGGCDGGVAFTAEDEATTKLGLSDMLSARPAPPLRSGARRNRSLTASYTSLSVVFICRWIAAKIEKIYVSPTQPE